MAGILLTICTIVFLWCFYLYERYLTTGIWHISWTIWLSIIIAILWISTIFAFLRLWWNIWNRWDNWINIWIWFFEFILCWSLWLVWWLGLFFHFNTFLVSFILILFWLILWVWAIYQVWLADEIPYKKLKYLILFVEWFIWLLSLGMIIYLLILFLSAILGL